MAKKISLSESDLTNLIEKVIKEQAARSGGFGYGFVQEDTEGEETYNYGADEGADHKEEMGLEHDMAMAPADRIGEIEKHLDALKKDMSYDSGHEDRGEAGTDFMESRIRRRVMESKRRRPTSRRRPSSRR
jgi:hypothetical protein|tara:strand:- start:364 stop:756 length:393 start_codon:yes stop_codon:yes gene_type:complete